jgi:hypothetical protein
MVALHRQRKQQREASMAKQPSSRQDLFGTEGVGEDESDIGTRGHSSQGGTASTKSGGVRGNDAGAQSRTGNPANVQGAGAMPKENEHAPPATGSSGIASGLQKGGTTPGGGPGAGLGSLGTGGGQTGGSPTGAPKRGSDDQR